MRFVYGLLFALLALAIVIFAVSNRAEISVTFWPLPALLEAPLYLVVLLALGAGFLLGEFVAWINAGRWRREARRRARRIEALERELAATQAQLPRHEDARLAPRTAPRD